MAGTDGVGLGSGIVPSRGEVNDSEADRCARRGSGEEGWGGGGARLQIEALRSQRGERSWSRFVAGHRAGLL